MIRADLHLHTLFSDGLYSPEEIARRVKDAGVNLFAVTDHDNMEGVERAERAARERGLFFVRGIEVSSYAADGSKVHVLGYRCRKNEAYSAFLKERTEGAYLRAEDSLKKANAYLGFSLDMREVEKHHAEKCAPVHTMHVVDAFSRALGKKRGVVYSELFAFGKPAYSGLFRPSPEDAIEFVHAFGGLAVLAHPAQIRTANLYGLFDRLAERGLDGIECYHSTHTDEESASFAAYAKEKNLLATGGSDFHEEGRKRILGLPEFYPSDALLKALSLS